MKPKPCTINPSRGRTDRAQEEGSIVVTPGQRVRLILSLGVLNLVLATIALGIGGVELQQQAAATPGSDIAAIPTPTPAEAGPTDASGTPAPTAPSGQPPAEPSSGVGPSLASASPSTVPGQSASASAPRGVTCHGDGITRADPLAGRHTGPGSHRPGRPDTGGHGSPDARGDDGTHPTRHRGTDRTSDAAGHPGTDPTRHSQADPEADAKARGRNAEADAEARRDAEAEAAQGREGQDSVPGEGRRTARSQQGQRLRGPAMRQGQGQVRQRRDPRPAIARRDRCVHNPARAVAPPRPRALGSRPGP